MENGGIGRGRSVAASLARARRRSERPVSASCTLSGGKGGGAESEVGALVSPARSARDDRQPEALADAQPVLHARSRRQEEGYTRDGERRAAAPRARGARYHCVPGEGEAEGERVSH